MFHSAFQNGTDPNRDWREPHLRARSIDSRIYYAACPDHVVAWKTRHSLGLDAVPMGVAPGPSDNLIFDIQNGVSQSGFGHPDCKGGNPSKSIIQQLNQKIPAGPK